MGRRYYRRFERESDHEKNDEPAMISVHDTDTDFEKTDTLSCPSQKSG